ncbi:MAG: DUF2007 domain-containing protein [Caldilineaceae bacterium]|nr:DUF2007 domain-containing protein [Caldilineaceae bacterium]
MTANPGTLPGWFRRRPDEDAQSGAETNSDEMTTTGATTGGRDDQSPVVVWEAANRMEAEIVAGRLHSEDIPAIIRGESLGAIYGLTTGSLAAATVLVPAALAAKALEILASAVEWDDAENADAPNNDLTDLPNPPRDG